MISKPDVFPLLLRACPSFQATWDDQRAYWGDDIAHGHIGMAAFAWYLVDLFLDGQTQCFPAVFAVAERMIIEGDNDVEDLATTGLLEDIQNIAGNRGLEWNVFIPWLGPQSRDVWLNLEKGWADLLIKRERQR